MLRKRKNRRYNETNDEEGDGERKFDLLEQIKSERFDQIRDKHLQELSGETINLRTIQKNGFEKPILVAKPDGLHLRVPPKSFLVRDVRNCVGPQRIIDVMDVKTQKNIEMSMKDWCKYYESKNRDRLLNVISLEFSHTKLDELVDSPMIVKLLDWVDLVWPKFLKQSQTESTNSIDKMKYPKVQKYCLMSVKGSYTDFHIDFGGTSVWYHILRGRKIFWMVPPTELNLQIFEEWTLSGMQQDVFFGDTVEECFRVELCAGNTFFIPSGWIHAVYTIEDSLVFGGNFLHSFGIENQLKVSKIEDATKVPVKFRYPFYTEILWYAVQHYVYCLMNKDHLHRPAENTSSSPSSAINSKQSTIAGIDKKTTATSNNSIEIEDESTESEYEESDKSGTKNNKKSKKAPSKTTAAAKRKRQIRPTKGAQKKSRKPLTSSDSSDNDDDETEEEGNDDDESTDIDSANEELYSKTVEKPTANTCRMTKNSLLRLQYEIDEHSATASSSTSTSAAKKAATGKSTTVAAKGEQTSLGSGSSKIASKSKSTVSSERQTPKAKPLMVQQPQHTPPVPAPSTIIAAASVNPADVMQESKLNGWPASLGGQNTWSSPKVFETKVLEPNDHEPKAPKSKDPARIHITKFEVSGLKVLVKHLSKLSGAKKNLPNLIRNSRALLDDCKKLIAEHENDDPELAITGKPITPELLKALHSNQKIDLNELNLKASPDKTVATNLDGLLLQLEPTQQSAINEKSATETDSSATQPIKPSQTTHNQKETKCLSPSKKLSNLTALSSGLATGTSSFATASPPPRPKSPPTRPLSNNQYTSKTKINNNNLLLPGSFADLIAATSTEKKVFDISTAEVSASLFGVKDLATSKSATSLTTSTFITAKSSPNLLKTSSKLSTMPTTPTSTTSKSIKSQQHDVTSATCASSIPFAGPTTIGGGSKPISPEPPKPNVPPKRFINPMGFRPPNKEKLIYASAPYISPVHASEQRSMSSQVPYHWQQHQAQQQQQLRHHPHHQPHHHPHHQQHQTQNPPTYSPSLASPTLPSNQRLSTNVHSSPSSSSEQHHQPASYTPDPQVLNQHHSLTIKSGLELNHDRQQPQEEQQQQSCANQLIAAKSVDCSNQTGNEDHKRSAFSGGSSTQANSVIVAPNHAQHPPNGASSSNGAIGSGPEDLKTKESIVKLSSIKTETQATNVFNERELTQPLTDGEQTVIKKPAKPRGPPKKSKEARQVALESTAIATSQLQVAATSVPLARFSLPLIPISVIKGGPSGDAVPSVAPGVVQPSIPSSAAPVVPVTTSAAIATASGTKTKTKRPKKQKDAAAAAAVAVTSTTNNSATEATVAAAQQLTTMAGANQVGPSVICGLVRSPLPISNLAQVQLQAQQKQQQPTVGIPVVTPVQGGIGNSSGAGKLNPQSYLISRPLFPFPSMPTFSAAQFQQMQQHQRPMNLLTAPLGAHPLAGLPLQQGARLVWATQPNRLMSPMPSNPQLATSATAGPPSSSTANNAPVTSTSLHKVPTSHSADNAALLSLATTALSTAPMTSSPALSHLNNRGLNPQAAMMMSSAAATAASQQAAAAQLFAGQQFFRPFLPMHYAALAQRPPLTGGSGLLGVVATSTTVAGSITTTAATTTTTGANTATALAGPQHRPLPGQQLLLARLPNQTNQQRYLITQPSFMQHHRFQAPNIVTSQPPTSTLAYAAYKPPADTSKIIKTKKVKTS